jgi:hypothetical protein
MSTPTEEKRHAEWPVNVVVIAFRAGIPISTEYTQ